MKREENVFFKTLKKKKYLNEQNYKTQKKRIGRKRKGEKSENKGQKKKIKRGVCSFSK